MRGILAANQRLAEVELARLVRISSVEFLEIYEDTVMSAAQILHDILASEEFLDSFEWNPAVIEQRYPITRRRRPPHRGSASLWRRIEIIDDRRNNRLRYILSGERARAEESISSGQIKLLDQMVAKACAISDSKSLTPQVLFEMLIPLGLKDDFLEKGDVILLLDEDSARFPWEMIENRWSKQVNANSALPGMIRQLKTSEFRARPTHSKGKKVLILASPALNGWNGFPDLPGAINEARQVDRLFSGAAPEFDRTLLLNSDSGEVMEHLHREAWSVLHLAGHGAHEFEVSNEEHSSFSSSVETPDGHNRQALPPREKRSGMLIGPNIFLTPGDIEQLRFVPEMVFINCCHLGKTEIHAAQHNLLAANLGVQFIRMGVRAVVCAGWAVDDFAAITFATVFYKQMLKGESFGESIRLARTSTKLEHPHANTWGAYQCYGDPYYRLVYDTAQKTKVQLPHYFYPMEAVEDLHNLTELTRLRLRDSEWNSEVSESALAEELKQITDRFPTELTSYGAWLERGDIRAGIGTLYGEARIYSKAVEWLNLALTDTEVPIRTIEQCANFRYRLASQTWSDLVTGGLAVRTDNAEVHAHLQVQRSRIASDIESALAELDSLNARAPNTERLSLLGAVCKRLAWVQQGPARTEALLNMGQYYRLAYERRGGDDAYAFTNWAVACLLLERADPDRFGEKPLGPWIDHLARLVERQTDATQLAHEIAPKLWHAVGLGDLMLVRMLLARRSSEALLVDKLTALVGDATEAYASAFVRGASLREVASVKEHFDFLLSMMQDSAPAWGAATVSAVKALRDEL